tara:strand:+ start:577 stop:1014 length:438 start_codon:yes stop_codon:yes gene_type:complete
MASIYKIFDNFLSPEDHQLVWHYIQNERLEFIHQSRWVKAFRLTDGNPLWGPPILSDPYQKDPSRPSYPSGKGIDLVIQKIKEVLPECEEIVGKQDKDWAYFFQELTFILKKRDFPGIETIKIMRQERLFIMLILTGILNGAVNF